MHICLSLPVECRVTQPSADYNGCYFRIIIYFPLYMTDRNSYVFFFQAALIMQVLQLTPEQIAMLPPEQRQSILILKEQIQKTAGAPWGFQEKGFFLCFVCHPCLYNFVNKTRLIYFCGHATWLNSLCHKQVVNMPLLGCFVSGCFHC